MKLRLIIKNFLLTSYFALIILFVLVTIFPLKTIELTYNYRSKDSLYLNTLVDFCNSSNEMEVIRCVNSYVIHNFNYKSSKRIIFPDELLNNGGDCKSWSLFYNAAFTKLGISTQFVELKSHVYLVAYNESYYCNVDQEDLKCLELAN